MSIMDRLKNIGGGDSSNDRTDVEEEEVVEENVEENDVEQPLEIQISDPGPDTDTCKIVLNRDLSPDKTEFFETYGEAEGWPMVQRIMRVAGVHSVIVKGGLLIVAKHAGAEWPKLLQPIEDAIRSELDPNFVDEVSPVDAIAAAAAGQGPEGDLRNRVQEILDSEINPSVASHGGYISLLDVQGTRIFLHMGGGCQGCGMASATLRHGVEATLRSQIPEISEILDTTDHAAGANPYYDSGF